MHCMYRYNVKVSDVAIGIGKSQHIIVQKLVKLTKRLISRQLNINCFVM